MLATAAPAAEARKARLRVALASLVLWVAGAGEWARAQQIVAGTVHSVAVAVGGGYEGWGSDSDQRKTGAPPGKTWAQLSAGNSHTCGVTTSGEGRCWGNNEYNKASGLPAGKTWARLSAGSFHTCGVTTSREGRCWGKDETNQVSGLPAGKTWAQLSAGHSHTCGVTTSGEGRCWGYDSYNQVSGLPAGKTWAQLSAGHSHTCGVTTSGEGRCWGKDETNQVSGLPAGKTWAQLSAGHSHTCGVTTSGEARCWGKDETNQVSGLPAGKTWAQLSAGNSHTCGVTTSGEPLCWGTSGMSVFLRFATVPTTLTDSRVDLSPAGFYRPGKDDIPCPAGWTSRPGGITVLGCSIRVLCPLGQEWTSPNCTLCSPGKYRSLTSAPNCTSCASGRYQDASGGVNCTSCSPGTFANTTGSKACQSCKVGTVAKEAGATACAPCSKGSFANVSGSATCILCLPGTFADATSSSQCKACLVGTFSNFEGSSTCAPCPEGSYENGTGSTKCKLCPIRTFADTKGLVQCKVCQAGTKYDGALLVTATAKPCAKCPVGTYRNHSRSDTAADNECSKCELGMSSLESSSSCTLCSPGKVGRLENGLAVCIDCKPGYYSSLLGTTQGCMYCARGKYANSSGSTACTDCPAGRYGDKEAQADGSIACAELCLEGHYGDKPGAASRLCSGPCPKGSYSRPGATECRLCPLGRYGDVEGNGVVGYTTPVCTGSCYFADYEAPRGSTCCPKIPGSCGPAPAPAPAPAPSSSEPSPTTSPASKPEESYSTTPLMIGSLVVLAVLLLLGATFLYLRSREDRGISRSAVNVAENVAEQGQNENAQEKASDSAKEGSSKEKEQKGDGKKNRKKRKNENRKPSPKASEVVPATTMTNTNVTSTNPGKAVTMPVNQELPQFHSTLQNPIDLMGENRYGPKHNVQGFHSGVSQSLSAATEGALFRSSQARVNLWNFMVIDNLSVERGKRLGQGAYAEVYEGKVHDLKCAIKLYRSTASQKQLEEAMREIRLTASLEHPCTLRLIGWVKHPLQTITELCLGDLKDFYNNKIEGLLYSEVRALMLLRESATGLLYLHTVGIIHRDIKPGNILVGGEKKNAKIADYGTSRAATLDATMTMNGTLVYQAPELSRGERYGFAADVFSFALTMYEVCDRDIPYTRSERDYGIKLAADIAVDGKRPPIPETWNPALSYLMVSCWSDNAELRLSLGQVMTSLSMIITAGGDMVTVATLPAKAETDEKSTNPDLPPGEPWRRVEIKDTRTVKKGEVLGMGSFSTVYKSSFGNEPAAIKLFRNTEEDKAFREIETSFALRHPNIIGLFAWFQERGVLTQIGMIIEFAGGGDLRHLYQGETFSFKIGLKVVLGAAKGLAHMHSMPTPVVHRDIKSGNVMVMLDGVTGKLGDCGESRRVDLNNTMTQTGSPLWAAPELLLGKRYNEDVDTFSFGAVLYEIAVRDIPYGEEPAKFENQKRGAGAKKIMREVANGERKPTLDGRVECRKYGVGGAFKKLLKHCVKFEPRQRPAMQDVVHRLEKIIEQAETKAASSHRKSGPLVANNKRTNALPSPWRGNPNVSTAMETFVSRIQDQESRARLEELRKHVTSALGAQATEPLSGVYNPARLFQFLCNAEMNVRDAKNQVVLNFNARLEFKLDAKRERIVREDLSFNTLPRMLEFLRYQPFNPFVGRAKDGRSIAYLNFGEKCNFKGLRKAFTIDEYINLTLQTQELAYLCNDAINAIEGRSISHAAFYDCSGGTIAAIMGHMGCTFIQSIGRCTSYVQSTAGPTTRVSATNIRANADLQSGSDAVGRAFPNQPGHIAFLVNFPVYAKMCLDMIKAGSGYIAQFEMLVPGTDLRNHALVTDLVDVTILPKAIGGDAITSFSKDGKEDETYTLGVKHPTLSAFLKGLVTKGGEDLELRREGEQFAVVDDEGRPAFEIIESMPSSSSHHPPSSAAAGATGGEDLELRREGEQFAVVDDEGRPAFEIIESMPSSSSHHPPSSAAAGATGGEDLELRREGEQFAVVDDEGRPAFEIIESLPSSSSHHPPSSAAAGAKRPQRRWRKQGNVRGTANESLQ